ncbi:MAG: hypothetical protein UV59_C0001G0016 [Candidatus Gottesmanbacteria bacterium GW2011_GWA1_43_11]|uniref:Glycosyltransferase RgtA/B/C/D-like domain-containing protein n=1 Tax=Candidatus Gottesmanbacteria bacterium GW2011_GWA1_43_11 TaxID=1618436 RepID=A0A0G1FHH8_9BACT|nr:MAG: hypothetical protein UV59_C0001G0016 [Candidatus Gottesmanbacteria bacterium GW2011_GWA1_43_11]
MTKTRWLLLVIFVGMGLRIILNTAVESFDFYAFVMWAKYLSTHSVTDVFEFLPEGYTPYPPLYYYVLMLLGHLISLLNLWDNTWLTYLIIRTPVFLADIGVCLLVYRLTKKYVSPKAAIPASIFYFLHPVIVYNTSVWGQIDSVVTLLGLLSIAFFISHRYFRAILIYTLGVLTKLQILALLPIIGFLSLVSGSGRRLFKYALILVPVVAAPFVPIVLSKGIKWTWDYFFTIPNWYAYTSVYTYNLWAPFGFIVSDNTKLLNVIEYKYIGILLFWFVALLILQPLFIKKNRTPLVLLFAAFLLWYDFSFFATRIHSRYLIYSFGFFAPFVTRFPLTGLLLSFLMVLNLLLPLQVDVLRPVTEFLNKPAVIILFVIFAFGLFIISFKRYRQLVNHHA